MSALITSLKLNYITRSLTQVGNAAANQEVINAVIRYINDNPDKFDPTIDITKLNQFVENYLQTNTDIFRGQIGPPVGESDIIVALQQFFNTSTNITFINASFSKITEVLNFLKCGNSTLTFYNQGNADNQYDIATNNILAKKMSLLNSLTLGNNLLSFFPSNNTSSFDFSTNIANVNKLTCSQLCATSGSSISITSNLVIGNNTVFKNSTLGSKDFSTNNFYTNTLNNDSFNITVNSKLLLGQTTLYYNTTQSVLNDIETGNLKLSSFTGKVSTVQLSPAFSTTAALINSDAYLNLTNGLIVSQIYFPVNSASNKRQLSIGYDRNDELTFPAKTIFNNNISVNADLTSQNIIATPTLLTNFITTKNGITITVDKDLNMNSRALTCGNITCASLSCSNLSFGSLYNVNPNVDTFNSQTSDYSFINKIHILKNTNTVVLPSIFRPGLFTPAIPYGSYVGFVYNNPVNPTSSALNNLAIDKPNSLDGSLTREYLYVQTLAIYIVVGNGYVRSN